MKSEPKLTFFQKKEKNPLYKMVQKWWKITQEICKLWHSKIFTIFEKKNISWPVLMNIQQGEMMMSYPHNFVHVSFTKMVKISFSGMAA